MHFQEHCVYPALLYQFHRIIVYSIVLAWISYVAHLVVLSVTFKTIGECMKIYENI